MEEKNNNKVLVITLIVIICLLAVLCVLFATGVIKLKTEEPKIPEMNEVVNQKTEECNCPETTTAEQKPVDSNIVVTKNGKVTSNTIPTELFGHYYNNYGDTKNDEYFKVTKDNIEVKFSTGSGNETKPTTSEKVYINYILNNNITIEIIAKDGNTYAFYGEKIQNKYYFKSLITTPLKGEGSTAKEDVDFEYPFSIDSQKESS